jgi:dihydrofolate synthase/folylpolyglutamate synthase
VLAASGDPQRRYPCVLIAGSNGKGSTSALLSSIAVAAGYRTGLYTSPHLESVEERLRLDGRAIETDRLGDLLERIVATGERVTGVPPTYFEALTLAAFLWFAEEEVDLAVVEVGLGGRLDATNLCEPDLSLVTSISLEHQEYLGDTLALIAREKAGIFRRGRPALAWVSDPEAEASLREVAAEVGAKLTFAPERLRIEEVSPEPGGQRVRLTTPERRYDLQIHLAGAHQARNLGLAILAAELLEDRFGRIDAESIARGVASCRWPGRLEEVMLPDGRRVLFDAAHNAEGVEALAAHLDLIGERPDLLFGVLQDKDAADMLGHLAPRANRIVLTSPASARARPPQEVTDLLGDREGVEVEPDRGRALDRALALGGELLVVCGSIYLIGEIRRELRERFGVPPAATEPLS